MTNIKGMELSELLALVAKEGESPYRARQIFSWIHKKFASTFEEMTNLSKSLRERFSGIWEIPKLKVLAVQKSKECDAVKYLYGLADGEGIESVLMYFDYAASEMPRALAREHKQASSPTPLWRGYNRLAVCVSTQAGCAYGCTFCASGLLGWKRNLECWEIVDQILQIQAKSKERISNVVFMGTGEPLANYENTLKAIRILNHPLGLGIGMRHMTISTVGLAPMIKRLADEGHPIRLAVSLHAPMDSLREQLMPVNKKYKISELLEACRYYQSKIKRRMTFEYTLIENVNDSPEIAKKLADLLQGLHCHVNLIPLNPLPEYPHQAPSPKSIRQFQSIMQKRRVPTTVRQERGQDIAAACGQLRRHAMKGSP